MDKQAELKVATGEEAARFGSASLHHADALTCYDGWRSPSLIVSDGAYGLGMFPGEPNGPGGLAEWYAPHAAAWAQHSKPGTTLWFWNREVGWAVVHPILELHGWHYEELSIWDKGIAHIAGNVNSQTIRGLPVVTEVAARYTRKATLATADGRHLGLQDWLRAEWMRSGLPMYQANSACGVKNAATRKYLTACHLWYFPPGEAVAAMANWCETNGEPNGGRPYFSIDGVNPPSPITWDSLRSKWNHTHGITNVWQEPAVHGPERVRIPDGRGFLHANQKPIALMERMVLAATDPGDTVWEPFGGLCSASVAAVRNRRIAHAAETHPAFYNAARERLEREIMPPRETLDFLHAMIGPSSVVA